MLDYSIRRVEDGDLDEIAHLEEVSLKAPWNKKVLYEDLHENPCSVLLVAVDRDKILGYLDFMITFDSATISRVAVFPEYRKKGIAKALLNEMVRICGQQEDHVDWITLEVRESNLSAMNLYLSTGWEKITVKKAYYDDGENAIYMVRNLL